MHDSGEVRSLVSLILLLWPVSFKVHAEKERTSSNIRVRIQNSGIHTVHIVDICVCDRNRKKILCINEGLGGQLGWDSRFAFPKTLSRNEPCFCVISLPVAFAKLFVGLESIHVMATDSTGKTRFSEAIPVDW